VVVELSAVDAVESILGTSAGHAAATGVMNAMLLREAFVGAEGSAAAAAGRKS